MNALIEMWNFVYSYAGESIFILLPFLLFVGVVAQWRLYEKADQPGISSIVPGWNFVSFVKIVGRPAWHALFIAVPLLIMFVAALVDIADLVAFTKEGMAAYANVSVSIPVIAVSCLFLIAFMTKVYIELCNSFGKTTVFDYFLVVFLNMFYILNLSLSYDTVYHGPVYGKSKESGQTQLA